MTVLRPASVVLAAAALVVVGAGALSPEPQQKAPVNAQWEFRVVQANGASDLEARLNKAGAEGWGDVVGAFPQGAGLVGGTVVLKRPKAVVVDNGR